MGRTQTKTTSFADRLVEWFVPDREALGVIAFVLVLSWVQSACRRIG